MHYPPTHFIPLNASYSHTEYRTTLDHKRNAQVYTLVDCVHYARDMREPLTAYRG